MLCAAAHAQTDSFYVWNKWCARRDTLLLFRSGNNAIQVYNKRMKPTEYKLKSLDKTLRIGDPEIVGDTMTVLAMPYLGKEKHMRLAILNARTSKVIKTLYFESDSIPRPVARIGTMNDVKEAAKSTIVRQTKLRVVFPNSLYSYPYTVSSYTFKDSTAKGPVNYNVKTFFLTNAVVKAISEAPDNSEIIFTDIKAICPECATRILPELRIKVK
ncbi:hypothetical protein GCM10023093_26950 [Nemorincola caseinilytica]|uniref:Gliding motility-associated protein GldM C-terminal domain-containing protein n=2 Tax=Nemorincola caseinilytica TaxID=2054315 RepID=A0ABP8NPH8_9BACT